MSTDDEPAWIWPDVLDDEPVAVELIVIDVAGSVKLRLPVAAKYADV
jgi:hypothetical protein